MQSVADHASEILHHLTTEVEANTNYQNYKQQSNICVENGNNNNVESSKKQLWSIIQLLRQSEVARFNYLVNDYTTTTTNVETFTNNQNIDHDN